jgi:hypothetical protein
VSGLKPLEDKLLSRYVALRKGNQRKEAAEAFAKLKERYPNKGVRMDLIRFFRKKSPLFLFLYWEERKRIGQELWHKLQSTLDYLIRLFAAPSAQGAGLLQTLKKALRVFPTDKIKAVALVRHFVWVSETFGYQQAEVTHLANGLLDYYGESTIEEPQITLVVPGRRSSKSKAAPVAKLDLSQVKFSQKDLEEILINSHVEGAENQTLLYCQKYWLKTEDADFETKISLYSKSTGSDHAKIYGLIQDGRRKALGDDEILFTVFNYLNDDQGYRYNVRRDITMQKIWAKIKPKGKVSLRGDMDLKEYAELREKKAREEKARRDQRAKELEAQRREKEEQAQQEAYERARALQEKKREIQEMAKERAQEILHQAEVKKQKALERQEQEKVSQDSENWQGLVPKEAKEARPKATARPEKTPAQEANLRASIEESARSASKIMNKKRAALSTQARKKNVSSSQSAKSQSSKRSSKKSVPPAAPRPGSLAQPPQTKAGSPTLESPALRTKKAKPKSRHQSSAEPPKTQAERNRTTTKERVTNPAAPQPFPQSQESYATNGMEENRNDEWAAWESPVDPRIADLQTHRILFRKTLEPVIEEFLWNHLHKEGKKLGGGQFSIALITIKEFILNNYLETDMNWSLSNQRQELKSSGLDIVNIDWIMDRCLEVLREKTAQAVH